MHNFHTLNFLIQTSTIPFDTSAYDAKIDPNDSILSIAERLAKYGGGGTDCSLPLVAANQKHAKRKFAGIILVSDDESWVGTGRHGSTGVMTAWEVFSSNQRKLTGGAASPKLVNIDLQPYHTVQACERADIMNIGGFSDAVFARVSAFLADNNQRFVAEVEAIELKTRVGLRSNRCILETHTRGSHFRLAGVVI